ncbi:hypothetical protein PRIPAC_87493 [Pristionchus pacificus]|uniref:Uncharacterized protein n=1 Tax=Pristionchus pacificus TaxID=54126 RepID=A0A2A6CX73_PRIPA|nr:hypothetical protein PRIPAC_87493 [Pristionchus pacificus]|eukprot:PDM82631.1 hypothetical protein PRIPAC_37024 [Pristionchus pacificus]
MSIVISALENSKIPKFHRIYVFDLCQILLDLLDSLANGLIYTTSEDVPIARTDSSVYGQKKEGREKGEDKPGNEAIEGARRI